MRMLVLVVCIKVHKSVGVSLCGNIVAGDAGAGRSRRAVTQLMGSWQGHRGLVSSEEDSDVLERLKQLQQRDAGMSGLAILHAICCCTLYGIYWQSLPPARTYQEACKGFCVALGGSRLTKLLARLSRAHISQASCSSEQSS